MHSGRGSLESENPPNTPLGREDVRDSWAIQTQTKMGDAIQFSRSMTGYWERTESQMKKGNHNLFLAHRSQPQAPSQHPDQFPIAYDWNQNICITFAKDRLNLLVLLLIELLHFCYRIHFYSLIIIWVYIYLFLFLKNKYIIFLFYFLSLNKINTWTTFHVFILFLFNKINELNIQITNHYIKFNIIAKY